MESAWQTWDMCTEAFDLHLTQPLPTRVEGGDLGVLEKCAVVKQDRPRTAAGGVLLDTFARKQRPYNAILALEQISFGMSNVTVHTKQAAYGVSHTETTYPAGIGR